MKKLMATALRTATLQEVPKPDPKEDEVLIKVQSAAPKHGTEVVDFRGLSPFTEEEFSEEWRLFIERDKTEIADGFQPFPLGNMITGEIVAVGSLVKDFTVGEKVCTYGPIMEYVTANAVNNHRLLKMPEKMSWKNAVCYDPAQFALGGVRDANVRAGDRVAVSGLGAIGQIAVQLAKKAGASQVIALDPLPERRAIARKYGADIVIDPTATDAGLEIKKATGKTGVDAFIETSGHPTALQSALRGIGYGGTIAYVAFSKEVTGGLNFGREAHFNNAKIIFSRPASEPNPDYPRWDRKRVERVCWELLRSGYIDCEDIIHPVVSFEESAAAYERYVDRYPDQSIKMGVTFDSNEQE